jgi:hypothetical protein
MTAKVGTVVAVLVCGLAFATTALADQTITAVGTAQEKVTPKDRTDNKSISDAVDAAHKASIPAAIQEAREEATLLAQETGLTLGAVQSVDENVAGGAFGYGYGTLAPFGPGQYCGTVTRVHVHRDKNGHRHTTRTRKRHCYVPPFVATSVAVTFAAS